MYLYSLAKAWKKNSCHPNPLPPKKNPIFFYFIFMYIFLFCFVWKIKKVFWQYCSSSIKVEWFVSLWPENTKKTIFANIAAERRHLSVWGILSCHRGKYEFEIFHDSYTFFLFLFPYFIFSSVAFRTSLSFLTWFVFFHKCFVLVD